MQKKELSVYTVLITETLEKRIPVKAHDEKEALEIVENLYRNAEIVLTDEIAGCEIKVDK